MASWLHSNVSVIYLLAIGGNDSLIWYEVQGTTMMERDTVVWIVLVTFILGIVYMKIIERSPNNGLYLQLKTTDTPTKSWP